MDLISSSRLYLWLSLLTTSIFSLTCLFVASSEVRIEVSVPVANENAKTPPIMRKIAMIRSFVQVAWMSP